MNDNERQAIIELAEVVKEILRILGLQKPQPHIERRIELAYKKAVIAKNRVS